MSAMFSEGTMVTELPDIVEAFELLGDWDARYQYLMELGENLPVMPEALKTDENRVKPCMSTVHVCACRSAESSDRIRFHGDCDTAIIKGVLAVLIALCNDRNIEDVQAIDMDRVFEQLQLNEHLSPNRHVGVYAIVELMKKQALQLGSTTRETA